jgi:hypothetical protein
MNGSGNPIDSVNPREFSKGHHMILKPTHPQNEARSQGGARKPLFGEIRIHLDDGLMDEIIGPITSLNPWNNAQKQILVSESLRHAIGRPNHPGRFARTTGHCHQGSDLRRLLRFTARLVLSAMSDATAEGVGERRGP